ncbi:MAG: hypothetical protein A2Y73_09295 [Chloroflexi bacterium RBG_13_56_8]|nr:MAG: hypothetical protein A2Y73_09295 [Chloroflexi bacterium RBG_13_56_8]
MGCERWGALISHMDGDVEPAMIEEETVPVLKQPWWKRYWRIVLVVVLSICALTVIAFGLLRVLRMENDALAPSPTLSEAALVPTDTATPALLPPVRPAETEMATATRSEPSPTPTVTPSPTPTTTPTISLLMGPAARILGQQTTVAPPQYVRATPLSGGAIGSIPPRATSQPVSTGTPISVTMPFKMNVAHSLAVNHWRYEITSVLFEPYLGVSMQDVILLGTLTNEGSQTDTFAAAGMMRLRSSQGQLYSEDLACSIRIPERYPGLSVEFPEDMAPGDRRYVGVCFLVPSDETSFDVVAGNIAQIWSGDIHIVHPAGGAPDVQLVAHLELVSKRGYQSATGDYFIVEGTVRNISDVSLASVEAVVTLYDDQFRFIASNRAFIAQDPLQSGATSTFQVILDYVPEIAHFGIEFMSEGEPLRTQDSTW